MNNSLIDNWNDTVNEDDTIYYLGDFGVPKNLEDVKAIISIVKKLNGKKYLTTGNHDYKLLKNEEFCSLFEEIGLYNKINDNGRYVIAMHYPLECWERSFHGSYYVHGHMHDIRTAPIHNRFNVCADNTNFKPVILDELIEEQGKLKLIMKVYKCDIQLVKEKLELFGFNHNFKSNGSEDTVDLFAEVIYEKEIIWFFKGFLW